MATFDKLPAEQQAIIELVVARGRTYDALADVLGVTSERVRELAREALVELAPVTGERVDPQWRGQVADYLLGQQSGAESTATRAHLKRSEPARTWALSLLDSLETLYENGNRPPIPEADAAPERAQRGRGAEAETAEPARERERPRERERKRERPAEEAAGTEPQRQAEKEPARVKEPKAEKPTAGDRAGGSLSPAAQEALRRRRVFAIVAGAGVLIALVLGVLAITGAFSSDDSGGSKGSSTGASTTATTPAANAGIPTPQPGQVLGVPLKPVGNVKASGAAYIAVQNNKALLEVIAKLPPLPKSQRKAAYNVWLYNSPTDAQSVGAQFTNPKGDYQGVGPLPANFKRYRYVDVSVQTLSTNNAAHSGNSVLRAELSTLRPVPSQQGAPPTGAGGAGAGGASGSSGGGSGASGSGSGGGQTSP